VVEPESRTPESIRLLCSEDTSGALFTTSASGATAAGAASAGAKLHAVAKATTYPDSRMPEYVDEVYVLRN
jgi:hypothetical protein